MRKSSQVVKRTAIKISPEHVRELRLLKEAWRKHSIDEVIEELIKPRRIDKVGVLEIEKPQEDR